MVGHIDTPVHILAIGVHPDDIELSCSGTLMKHISKGYTVGICDLTMGQLGSRGNHVLRLREAEEAKQIIGASWRVNLEMEDGWFRTDKEGLLPIIKVIRAACPKIVLCNALEDRHPDHGRSARLEAEACFYAGLSKIETEWNGENQEAFRPHQVLHYVQDRDIKPDFVVDISDYMDKKIEAIKAFSSQFFTGEEDEHVQTPISSRNFMDYMYAKNRVYARDIQKEYAEAFHFSRLVGIEDLTTLL